MHNAELAVEAGGALRLKFYENQIENCMRRKQLCFINLAKPHLSL